MRINKYLADKQYASRRGADALIEKGCVFINGKLAKLGDSVNETDVVEVKEKKGKASAELAYFAYNKPVGVVTHSPQKDEKDIRQSIAEGLKSTPLQKSVDPTKLFPIGRLDKDSHGLLILTNDGRITSKLLDPEEDHEKEYVVETDRRLPENFETRMERGVTIEDGNGKRIKTKPCIVKVIGDKKFTIILTEGKKRQIRKMCEEVGVHVKDLKRTRIMDITIGHLGPNSLRRIKGDELDSFLNELKVRKI